MTQGIATSKNKQYILVNYAEGKMHDYNKILCFSRGPLFLCCGGRWNAIWKSFDPPPLPQLLDPFLVTFLDDSICPPSENQAGTRWFPALSSTFSLMDHNTINLSTVCEKKLYFTNA